MSVIAANAYRNGAPVRSLSLSAPEGLKLAPDEFAWIGLHEPTAEELGVLADHFRLHPLAIEDALKAHQIPKAEVYDHELFVVAKTAQLDEDQDIAFGETHIFVGPQHIITVRHGSARAHTALRAQLEAAPRLLAHGGDYVLHAVLDFIVDGYLPIVDSLEEEVLEMEQRTLDSFLSRPEITRIFELRRELTRFRRILGPMEEMASRLEHLDTPCIDPEVRPYFRDVLDHVRRVAVRVETLRDALGSVFEVANLLEQQRQGVITRKLAAWAAILAVPTAVAGIYGMNFRHMPELEWTYGYYLVLAAIAVICAGLYYRFKESRWL
ncbi:magnesium and cobalt transport protein CorA [Phenylobacterium sp. J367]|uniref:magnesium and cobalt transport protein CorA n=1 Tax=Phenylobacterium sp. J367 TaxID=2898435 RepID=UPI00215138A2|nr:magnesium and cobalt transport protein CorA [Phenylobacterium sp. J367]MCR5880530.1 magnesium and cobalt transport protein CorA [Phenylobacterium sp. J367]